MARTPLVIGALVLALWCGAAAAEEPLPREDHDPLFDDDFEVDDGSEGDPLEGMNRGIFSLNQLLDAWVFDPATEAYQFVFPELFRDGINNVFFNLQSPVIMLNQLLQLRGEEAARTAGRFVINTTAGGGGFFDAADRGAGLERVDADFGQTLAAWGTPSGPFLMLPILGPSTVRDGFGDLVDRGLDPLTYLIGPVQWWIPIGLSQGLAIRDAHLEELNLLKEGSIDYYSALRSAYLQRREAEIGEALICGRDPGPDESATAHRTELPPPS